MLCQQSLILQLGLCLQLVHVSEMRPSMLQGHCSTTSWHLSGCAQHRLGKTRGSHAACGGLEKRGMLHARLILGSVTAALLPHPMLCNV